MASSALDCEDNCRAVDIGEGPFYNNEVESPVLYNSLSSYYWELYVHYNIKRREEKKRKMEGWRIVSHDNAPARQERRAAAAATVKPLGNGSFKRHPLGSHHRHIYKKKGTLLVDIAAGLYQLSLCAQRWWSASAGDKNSAAAPVMNDHNLSASCLSLSCSWMNGK